MGVIEKYLVVKEYFGLSAINIENISRTFKEREMKIQQIKENFNVIEPNNYSRLKNIILALQKPKGKRADREIEIVYPLLAKLDFFEKLNSLKKKELIQVC